MPGRRMERTRPGPTGPKKRKEPFKKWLQRKKPEKIPGSCQNVLDDVLTGYPMTAPPVYLRRGAAVAKRYPSVRRLRTMTVSWPTLRSYGVTVEEAVREAREDRLYALAGLVCRRLPNRWTSHQVVVVLIGDYCDAVRPLYLDHTQDQTDRDLADVRTLDEELRSGAAGLRSWLYSQRRDAV